MNYYILTSSANNEIIGTKYPQVQLRSNNIELSLSLEIIDKNKSFLKPNSCLDYFILDKNAIATDILSSSQIKANRGFLANKKVIDILNSHNLSDYAIYPTTIKHKDKILKYFFIHLRAEINKKPIIENCDISQSLFFVGNIIGKKKYVINSESLSNLQQVRKDVFTKHSDRVFCTHFYFDRHFLNQLDLFNVNFCNFDIFISNKLFQAFKKEQITGAECISTNRIITSIDS